MWLVCLVLLLIAGIVLMWAAVFGALVVGGAASMGLCPRCGVSLDVSDSDLWGNDNYIDKRYRSKALDSCAKCGWRRTDAPP